MTEDYKEILNKMVIERAVLKEIVKELLIMKIRSTDNSAVSKAYLKTGYLSTAQWSDDEIDKALKKISS